MSKYNSFLYKRIIDPLFDLFAEIRWEGLRKRVTGRAYNLQFHDFSLIAQTLERGYFVILTRRKAHLTTYLIGLADLVLRGNKTYWTHALMNVEGDEKIKLVEATAKGVQYATFFNVFDCDAVAILKPKHYSVGELSRCIDFLLDDIGKPYDSLFDLLDQTHMSCVEVVRGALMMLPDYQLKMAEFERLIKSEGNLTPQMFYECSDFEVVLEIRR